MEKLNMDKNTLTLTKVMTRLLFDNIIDSKNKPADFREKSEDNIKELWGNEDFISRFYSLENYFNACEQTALFQCNNQKAIDINAVKKILILENLIMEKEAENQEQLFKDTIKATFDACWDNFNCIEDAIDYAILLRNFCVNKKLLYLTAISTLSGYEAVNKHFFYQIANELISENIDSLAKLENPNAFIVDLLEKQMTCDGSIQEYQKRLKKIVKSSINKENTEN